MIVEDHENTGRYFEKILSSAGYDASAVTSAKEALSRLKQDYYSVLLTDWIMPEIDGIELIKKVHDELSYTPVIFMITSKISRHAQNMAIEAGADVYIFKPVVKEDLVSKVEESLKKLESKPEPLHPGVSAEAKAADPPFPAAVIAVSTGGPPALAEFFKEIPRRFEGTVYIVQHGPAWMLESLSSRINVQTDHSLVIAEDGMNSQPGKIYLAPGMRHMIIEPDSMRIILDDGPKVNYCKPAADPLFISASRAFGKYCLGVILTGLGSDGVRGAAQIAAGRGKVFIQDPNTAVAPSMPRSAVESGIPAEVMTIKEIGRAVNSRLFSMAAGLNKNKTVF